MKNLKTILFLAVILLAFAVFGYLKAVPTSPPEQNSIQGPKIMVEPKVFDFGEVQRPAVVDHEFTVKNTGRETLEIRRVSTSCSCTTAKIDKKEIEPGEKAALVVTYDSGAMKHEKGRIERIVYIKSNDPDNPQLEVTIYASVK